jgi:DNA replication initiation complex subunit (GINS family)
MAEILLEYLNRHLDLEEESKELLPLPADFYSRIAVYTRNLKRASSSSNSEVTNRLISRQSEIIQGIVSRFVALRAGKARASGSFAQLLPEERQVCLLQDSFERRIEEFVEAVTSGQSSYLELAIRKELGRNVTVRFVKPVSELIGSDLRRYGPFQPNDLASIPAANADILVANGEALVIHTRG